MFEESLVALWREARPLTSIIHCGDVLAFFCSWVHASDGQNKTTSPQLRCSHQSLCNEPTDGPLMSMLHPFCLEHPCVLTLSQNGHKDATILKQTLGFVFNVQQLHIMWGGPPPPTKQENKIVNNTPLRSVRLKNSKLSTGVYPRNSKLDRIVLP